MIQLGIICGGKSTEHEISLLSAINIIKASDQTKYNIILIGISKDGIWQLYDPKTAFINAEDPKKIHLNNPIDRIVVVPDNPKGYLIKLSNPKEKLVLDCIFPILHGPYGEDGSVQGLLKCANIPFVGAGVLGSAVGMDKDVMKRLLRDAKIPIAPFICISKKDQTKLHFSDVIKTLNTPLFIKPANTGSSIGISKVINESEFNRAMEEAFQFDTKILIEQGIQGREIECAVLGNETPKASVAGEVCPKDSFYSYQAKYLDDDGAKLIIPVELTTKELETVQATALKTYQTLCCEGLARVDMFLTPDGQAWVNEINTLPGFTKISMYPKLWECSGISQVELIDELINLAINRNTLCANIQTSI